MRVRSVSLMTAVMVAILVSACAKPQVPVAKPVPPPSAGAPEAPSAPSPRPTAVPDQPVVAEPTMTDDPMATRTIDELNRDSPLKPAFFDYDSDELTAEARGVLDENAAILKRYSNWAITIEGHCDERGTAEYNLALGERRAVAALSYLVSLGVEQRRVRTVSYGKEFPFDPGHDESAWALNRRAHFVITGK
ncbi:MAG: peptidoglycan-associated lipoprotein Pal [Acidobacteriota bacterium]